MAARKPQHVVPDGDFWAVKKAGSSRASSFHRTQDAAIKAARKAAAKSDTELVIHGRDGQIRDKKGSRKK